MTMLLECVFNLEDEGVAPPRATLAELRKEAGGFSLNHKILQQPGFFQRCRMLYVRLQISWDYYSQETETIKSPSEGFAHRIYLSAFEWWEI